MIGQTVLLITTKGLEKYIKKKKTTTFKCYELNPPKGLKDTHKKFKRGVHGQLPTAVL